MPAQQTGMKLLAPEPQATAATHAQLLTAASWHSTQRSAALRAAARSLSSIATPPRLDTTSELLSVCASLHTQKSAAVSGRIHQCHRPAASCRRSYFSRRIHPCPKPASPCRRSCIQRALALTFHCQPLHVCASSGVQRRRLVSAVPTAVREGPLGSSSACSGSLGPLGSA